MQTSPSAPLVKMCSMNACIGGSASSTVFVTAPCTSLQALCSVESSLSSRGALERNSYLAVRLKQQSSHNEPKQRRSGARCNARSHCSLGAAGPQCRTNPVNVRGTSVTLPGSNREER